MRVPKYIRTFMGDDFRAVEGVNAHFILTKFSDPDFRPVENVVGCYVISAIEKNIEYPKGKSPILYIGLSKHLLTRLKHDHYRDNLKKLLDNPNYGLRGSLISMMQDKYQYMYYLGAKVDVFYCKGTQSAKEFESRLIANFYYKYRSMPVGNGARSFSQR